MQKLVVLPQIELNMENVQVVRWMVKEGDVIEENTGLLEVETQKSVSEVPAMQKGVVRQLLVQVGDRIAEKTPICILTDLADEPLESVPAASFSTSAAPKIESTPSNISAVSDGRAILAPPAVRRVAKERGIDLATIKGTGPGGRIIESDLDQSRESSEGWKPFSNHRLSLIRQMNASLREIPQIRLSREMEVAALLIKVKPATFTHRLILALGKALARHPLLCSAVRENEFRLLPPSVAIAMETATGLVAPVIRRPDCLPLDQIVSHMTELRERAEAGRLSREDFTDAPFALSNLGMFGVDLFDPFAFQGQVAVLAIGRARALEDKTHRAWFTLAADHRIVDGAEAARFLGSLQEEISRLAAPLS